MVNSKKEPLEHPTRRKALPAQRKGFRGGTIVNVVTALIFFGLIGFGLWWVIKSIGRAGQQYSEVLIDTKYAATTVQCQTNLRAIGQSLQMYVISNENLPPSLQALVQWTGNTQIFRCPDANGQQYIYIPGQRPDISGENVLLYEPNAVHNGRCNVLRLSGQIELLTPEELQAAVARTMAGLR